MNKFIMSLILPLIPLSSLAADCMKNAATQADMNLCSATKAQLADKDLNQLYQQIITTAKSDPIAIKKIRAAQRAWITFRDAQIAMYYPHQEPGWYGSTHPVCVNAYYEELTRKRISELNDLLKKPVEGDVCAPKLRK